MRYLLILFSILYLYPAQSIGADDNYFNDLAMTPQDAKEVRSYLQNGTNTPKPISTGENTSPQLKKLLQEVKMDSQSIQDVKSNLGSK